MGAWLQIVLGASALAFTVGSLLVKVGAWGGNDDARVKRLEDEVTRLREWRHTVGNFQQKEALLDVLVGRIERLEAKVFRSK